MNFFVVTAPYIIIYAISGFKKNHSTLSQRVWMMLWIAYPTVSSRMVEEVRYWGGVRSGPQFIQRVARRVGEITIFLTSGCVVVGGLVTLSKMILEIGMCELY